MKFPQLAIGQRFQYEGGVYTKTGPLLAHAEESGRSRLIPRCAEVMPLAPGAPAAVPRHTAALDPESVRRAFAAYEAAARDCLREASPGRAQARLAETGREFLRTLGLPERRER